MNSKGTDTVYRKAGFLSVLIPATVVILGIAFRNILFLDYVHVLLGAVWIGVDAFFGIIFRFVFRGISEGARAGVARRMLPATLFFLPATSILTPLAGYFLASYEGIWNPYSPVIQAILVTGSALVIVGFGTVFLQSLHLMTESQSALEDRVILRRFSIICNGALVQLLLQIALVSLMAQLVVYG